MRYKRSLIRRLAMRVVRICTVISIAAAFGFIVVLNKPIGVALTASIICSTIAAVYLISEIILFVLLDVRGATAGGIMGAMFSLLVYVIWCWAFSRKLEILGAVTWVIPGIIIGVKRGKNFQRLYRSRTVASSSFRSPEQ